MQRISKMIVISLLALAIFSGDSFAQKRGGTLRVAMNRTFNGFDTATSPTVFPTKLNVQRAMYEDLFSLDENGKLVPILGTALKISPDQKLFTVTLRKGVKISNGEPFTARAFVDHFKRAMKATINANINDRRARIDKLTKSLKLKHKPARKAGKKVIFGERGEGGGEARVEEARAEGGEGLRGEGS